MFFCFLFDVYSVPLGNFISHVIFLLICIDNSDLLVCMFIPQQALWCIHCYEFGVKLSVKQMEDAV